jgi:hypothetical protein
VGGLEAGVAPQRDDTGLPGRRHSLDQIEQAAAERAPAGVARRVAAGRRLSSGMSASMSSTQPGYSA